MKGIAVCLAAPALRGRKETPENADKLMRQYVPESMDFGNPGNSFPKGA